MKKIIWLTLSYYETPPTLQDVAFIIDDIGVGESVPNGTCSYPIGESVC